MQFIDKASHRVKNNTVESQSGYFALDLIRIDT